MLPQDLAQERLRIKPPRIDRETRALGWKAAFRLGKSELVTGKVHQVGTVFAIMDGEIDVQPDLLGVDPQQLAPNPMECTGPG